MAGIDSRSESQEVLSDSEAAGDVPEAKNRVLGSTSDSEDKHSLHRSSSEISVVNQLFGESPKNFCVGKYKTGFCKLQNCPQTECCYYHNAMEKRRNLYTYDYSPKPCRYVYVEGKWGDPSICKFREKCFYAHTANEVNYHRDVFGKQVCTAQPCTMGSKCYCTHSPKSQPIKASDLEAAVQRSVTTQIIEKPAIPIVEDSAPNSSVPESSHSPMLVPREAFPSVIQSPPSANLNPGPTQPTDVRPVVAAILQEYSDLREQHKRQNTDVENLRTQLAELKKQRDSAVLKISCGSCRKAEMSQVLQACGHAMCNRCADLAITAEKCSVCSAKAVSKCALHLISGHT